MLNLTVEIKKKKNLLWLDNTKTGFNLTIVNKRT